MTSSDNMLRPDEVVVEQQVFRDVIGIPWRRPDQLALDGLRREAGGSSLRGDRRTIEDREPVQAGRARDLDDAAAN